jgi:uncharacterized protein YbjT (DUF2867 family)
MEVTALVRRPFEVSHPKLKQLIIDFETLDNYKKDLSGDVIYCCLGSTIKKTPDLTDYRKVDHDYPLALGKIAVDNSIAQYHLVSALGADQSSKIFYTRLKGETERDLKDLKIKSLHIYQPALLTGNRMEHRKFEKFYIGAMKLLNPLLMGGIKKYRSIEARTVAQTMINQTFKNLEGVNIYPSNIIEQLA